MKVPDRRHCSVTSSKTMPIQEKGIWQVSRGTRTQEALRGERNDDELTKSSNPSSVPLSSQSFFLMTQNF